LIMRRIVLVALLSLPFFVQAQMVAKTTVASNGKTIGFLEYKPANYSSVTTKYPLIIFLHGIGQRGNGTTEIDRVKTQAIPRNITNGSTMTFTWNGKTETFLVLAPQCSMSDTLWYPFYIDAMLKYAKASLRADTNRIFLTGLSMGGGGVWSYASASLTNSSRFAGLVPVCPACLMTNASNIGKTKAAVYAFHALDDVTPVALPSCTIKAIADINKYNPPNRAVATYYPTGGHVIWAKAYYEKTTYQNPTVYEWMLNQNKSLTPNKVPVARAGNDTLIQASSGLATLKGTLSTDADGTILRYIWTKISGPAAGVLTNGTRSIASLSGLTAGIYKYSLKVIDSRASWALDTMTITVNATPLAKAGLDGIITVPASSWTVNGSASSDPDGTITSYKWTKISGPTTYTITNSVAASTSITNLTAGVYTFRLTVKDNRNGTAYDDMLIVVNRPPIAKAGADSTIKLPKNTTTLIGSGSSDPDGTITYLWSKIAGPTTFTITSPTLANTGVKNLVAGIYTFRLTVKDNRGVTAYDDKKVTVLAATAAAPGEVSLRDQPASTTGSVRLLPTVVKNTLQVQITSDATGNTSIRIHDVTGKQLKRVQLNKDTKTIQSIIQTSGIKPGVYQVEVVIGKGERMVERFVKE
jgi:poly(3-hydroxybutyrate) depolymerase